MRTAALFFVNENDNYNDRKETGEMVQKWKHGKVKTETNIGM